MFDVGFAEVFLLGLIGLLVLGPERLPAVARTLGGYVRKARSSWYSLKRSVEAELAAADAANPLKAAKDELDSVQKQVNEIGQSLAKPVTGAPSRDDTQDESAGNDLPLKQDEHAAQLTADNNVDSDPTDDTEKKHSEP